MRQDLACGAADMANDLFPIRINLDRIADFGQPKAAWSRFSLAPVSGQEQLPGLSDRTGAPQANPTGCGAFFV